MSALEPWLVLFTAQVGWNSAIFIEAKKKAFTVLT